MAADTLYPFGRPHGAASLAAHPYAPRPFVVRGRTQETVDTVTLQLSAQMAGDHLSFRGGQFNMVYVFGVGESAISISGDAGHPEELVHTVRAVGKVTNALAALKAGAVVGIRGPYGRGWPLDSARGRDVVIVAGGLGLPPLRPILYDIFRQREAFGRVEIIYGARTPKDLVFYDEVQTWRQRTDLRIQTTVDAAGREWYGDVGVVTTRIPDSRFDPPNTTAFICGPEIMMKLTAQALTQRGVPTDAIWLSMERNMKCALGFCGHCQYGPSFVCRDGPVLPYRTLAPLLAFKEV
ncbi:MAG TPA: FAD/NAD(P)-binding protein [Thermoplasmata archaeon]|nr:FAD/NAD(P)-binding protein [Thermoplasmata archaeon]